MQTEIFIEHVDLKAKNVRLERLDFNSLRSALAFLKGKGAVKVGTRVISNNQKTVDHIRTFTEGSTTYYLTKRVWR